MKRMNRSSDFMWQPAVRKERVFDKSITHYLSVLFESDTTISLPTFTSILDLEFNFKDVSRKCEKLDHGIFHFENIFTFYDSKFYQSDNTWGVIIIQLKEQKLWSYGLSTTTRTDLSRNIDALLREESNRLKESTSIASAFNLKTPEFEQLQSNQMSDFSFITTHG